MGSSRTFVIPKEFQMRANSHQIIFTLDMLNSEVRTINNNEAGPDQIEIK